MNKYLFVLLSFALVALPPTFAAADQTPDIHVQLESDVVEVGDTVDLTLTANVQGDESPAEPELGKSAGFHASSPRVATSRTMSIVNGRRSDGLGVNVTWTLRADRVGTFTIGPPSIRIGKTRFGVRGVTIRVVPRGQAPQRSHNPFADPFGSGGQDPFQALLGGMLDPQQQQQMLQQPSVVTDPALALDAPRGRSVFLHATLDKTNAVVGEQVTLTVELYVDATQREPAVNDIHEATATDFLKKSLREDDSVTDPIGNANVGGQLWSVKVVRRSALFPLRTGDLEIGPMSLSIVRGNQSGSPRESETLHVHVTEPPTAGRPPGYAVGDVGHFALNSEVTPRKVEHDGAIGIDVDLTGSGNMPNALPLPSQPGVEWLTPETHEKLGPLDGGKYGGSRHFSYVVRLHKSGHVDLGDIALPYWDADAHTYAFARTKLGAVEVEAGTNGQKTTPDADDVLTGLPAPLMSLAGTPSVRTHRTDRPIFWLGLFGAPIAVAVASGASSLVRRMRTRAEAKTSSPLAEWKEKVAIGDRAMKEGDPQGDAAILRALHSAPLAFFGVSIRAARDEAEVTQLLEDAGVPSERAQAYAELVHACEVDRYAPEPAPIETIRARWIEAKRLMNELRP